jgi:hypothetical protein
MKLFVTGMRDRGEKMLDLTHQGQSADWFLSSLAEVFPSLGGDEDTPNGWLFSPLEGFGVERIFELPSTDGAVILILRSETACNGQFRYRLFGGNCHYSLMQEIYVTESETNGQTVIDTDLFRIYFARRLPDRALLMAPNGTRARIHGVHLRKFRIRLEPNLAMVRLSA